MSTSMVPQNLAAQLPAHLRARVAEAAKANAAIGAGISDMAFDRLVIDGSKFHIRSEGRKTTITDGRPSPGAPEGLPLAALPVVLVGANPAISKIYFKEKMKEGDGGSAPDCSSEDGITPDQGVPAPQSNACATCPQNVWGSKISEASGKEIKACDDAKNIVVVIAPFLGDIEGKKGGKPLHFKVPPTALKGLKRYIDELSAQGVQVRHVETMLTFDPSVRYPLPVFSFSRFLTEEEVAQSDARANSDEVKRIATPRAFAAGKMAAGAALVNAVAQASAPVVQAVVTPAPAAPVVTVPTAAAPSAPTGHTVSVSLPTAAPAAPVAVPAAPAASGSKPKRTKAAESTAAPATPAVAPAAVADPLAGQPAHVVTAVNAAGGLSTDAGKAVFAALTLGSAPVAPAAAMMAPPVAPPLAPIAAVAVLPAAAPIAVPPAQAAPETGAVPDLAAVLRAAMGKK